MAFFVPGELDLGLVMSDPWQLTYEGTAPEHEGHREALTTLGNGYMGGMASGAHAILIPEHRVSLQQIAAWVRSSHERGRAPLVVVAEAFAPTAFDRVLATRLGMAAVGLAYAGRWGTMVSLKGTDITDVPLASALGDLKTVPEARYKEAEALFG